MVELRIHEERDERGEVRNARVEMIEDGEGNTILATVEAIEGILESAQKGSPTVDGKPIEFTHLEGMELLDTITLGKVVLKHTERSIEAQRQGQHIQQVGYGNVFEFEVGAG